MQPAAAHAIVIYKGKFLLLLRDDKPEIPEPNTWSLLGGLIEKGETPDQALIRELDEEANIKADDFKLLLEHRPGGYIYLLYLTEDQVKSIKLGNEGQKLEYFTLDEISKINLGGSMKQQLSRYLPFLEQLAASS